MNLVQIVKENRYLTQEDIDITKFPDNNEDLNIINQIICAYFNMEKDYFQSKKRCPLVRVTGKKLFCYFAMKYTTKPSGEIGKHVNYLNHSTVLCHRNEIRGLIDFDKEITKYVTDIEKIIRSKL